MLCGLCSNTAKFICNCSKFYICASHLNIHTSEGSNHQVESLEIELDEFDKTLLKNELNDRICHLENAKESITLQTKVLIKEIEASHKKLISKFESQLQEYLIYLQLNYFSKSQYREIERIIQSSYEINPISLEFGLILKDTYESALIINEKKLPDIVLNSRKEEKTRRKEKIPVIKKDYEKSKTKSAEYELKEIYEAMKATEIGY